VTAEREERLLVLRAVILSTERHRANARPRRRVDGACYHRGEPAAHSMDSNKRSHPHEQKRALTTVTAETSHTIRV